jgi:hypothetical protein
MASFCGGVDPPDLVRCDQAAPQRLVRQTLVRGQLDHRVRRQLCVQRARPAGGLEQAVATSRASSLPASLRSAPGRKAYSAPLQVARRRSAAWSGTPSSRQPRHWWRSRRRSAGNPPNGRCSGTSASPRLRSTRWSSLSNALDHPTPAGCTAQRRGSSSSGETTRPRNVNPNRQNVCDEVLAQISGFTPTSINWPPHPLNRRPRLLRQQFRRFLETSGLFWSSRYSPHFCVARYVAIHQRHRTNYHAVTDPNAFLNDGMGSDIYT